MGSGFFGEQMVHHIKLVCTQSAEKIVQTMNTLVVSCILTALLIKEGTTWGQRRPPVPKQTGTLQGHTNEMQPLNQSILIMFYNNGIYAKINKHIPGAILSGVALCCYTGSCTQVHTCGEMWDNPNYAIISA